MGYVTINREQKRKRAEYNFEDEVYYDETPKRKNDWQAWPEYYEDEPTQEEKQVAAASHFAAWLSVLGGFMVPVSALASFLIYLNYRDRSAYVARNALQATIFQLMMTFGAMLALVVGSVAWGLGLVVAAISVIALIGIVLLPVWIVLGVVGIITLALAPVMMPLFATAAGLYALSGRTFHYPLMRRYFPQTYYRR
jgi:uncharacterized Tic20 family protein